MARNPELEALLQAKYDLDNCALDERERLLHHFHRLLDRAIAKSGSPGLSRSEFEEILRQPYREFRLAKITEQRAKLSRLR